MSRRTDLLLVLAMAAIVFLLELGVFRPLIEAYFPSNDEISLIAASADLQGKLDPGLWFTQGFSDYFHSFPEWQTPSEAFTRPAANAWYWLNYAVFGEHWRVQLLIGYFAHALVVGLIGWIALGRLGLSRSGAAAAMLLAAFNPGLMSRYKSVYPVPAMEQLPVYHTEIVAAALTLLAFLAFTRRRFVAFGLLTAVAVMMKETALTGPIAALLLVGAWRDKQASRSLRNVVWIALPLLLWSGARLLFFEKGMRVYPLDSEGTAGFVLQAIRNLLLMPEGLYTASLRDTLNALTGRHFPLLALNLSQLLFTMLGWLVIVWALSVAVIRFRRHWLSVAPEPWLMALLFALGNLALVVLLPATQLRYGYFWFALGPTALLAFLAEQGRSNPQLIHRRGLLVATALILGSALVATQIGELKQSLSTDSLDAYRRVKTAARSLTEQLHELPSQTRTVYVVDEVFSLVASPHYLARLAHFDGRIVFVTGVLPIVGCRPEAADRYHLTQTDGVTTLDYRRAACLSMVALAPLSMFSADNRIERGPSLSYWFPGLRRLADTRVVARQGLYELGDSAVVRLANPDCVVQDQCVWLAYDEIAQRYTRLTESAAPQTP